MKTFTTIYEVKRYSSDMYNEMLDIFKKSKYIKYVCLIENEEDFKETRIASIITQYEEYPHANLSACGNFVVVAVLFSNELNFGVYFIPIELANKYPTIFDSIYVSIH